MQKSLAFDLFVILKCPFILDVESSIVLKMIEYLFHYLPSCIYISVAEDIELLNLILPVPGSLFVVEESKV